MKWLLIGIAVVVLFALAWWQSGRARPGRGGGRLHDSGPVNSEHVHADYRSDNLRGPG